MRRFVKVLSALFAVIMLFTGLPQASAAEEQTADPKIPLSSSGEPLDIGMSENETMTEPSEHIYDLSLSKSRIYLLPGMSFRLTVSAVTEPFDPQPELSTESTAPTEETTAAPALEEETALETTVPVTDEAVTEEITLPAETELNDDPVMPQLSEIEITESEATETTAEAPTEETTAEETTIEEATTEPTTAEETTADIVTEPGITEPETTEPEKPIGAITPIPVGEDDNESYIWRSNDESVATVSSSGVVTAVSFGSTVITVTTLNQHYADGCEVFVVDKLPMETTGGVEPAATTSTSYTVAISPNYSWSTKPNYWAVRIGSSDSDFDVNFDVYKCFYDGTYINNGEGDISSQVKWVSSDNTVATVDQYGRVTGKKEGTTTIFVIAKDSSVVISNYNAVLVTVYTKYSSVKDGIAQSWVNQYKSTVSGTQDDLVKAVAPGTELKLHGKSGGFIYAALSNETTPYFMWGSGVAERSSNHIVICKSGATSDTRRHRDVYKGNTVTLSLAAGGMATWTSSDESIAKVSTTALTTNITISALAEGNVFITAKRGSDIDIIHLTVITKYSQTIYGSVKPSWCSKYKCTHTKCTIFGRKEGDTGPGKLIRIFGESGGFYYANVVGESTYIYMWKSNIYPQSDTWVKRCELDNLATSPRSAQQGFAVDSNYCYSFEIRGERDEDMAHRLFRYDIVNGTRMQMTVQNGKSVGKLYHANDAAIVYFDKNGVSLPYIFVAAYNADGKNYVVKLGFNDVGEYWEEARYPLPDLKQLVGITLLSGGGSSPARFLIRIGLYFYEATITSDKPTGSLLWNELPRKKFDVTGDNAPQGGWQGIHYERSNGKLYFACSGTGVGVEENFVNTVYIYDNADNLTATGVGYNSNREIRNSAGTYFEIEGVGFRDGVSDDRLWFLTFEGDHKNGGIYTDLLITK